MSRLLLSDLPPHLLAALRRRGLINGTGPRTIKVYRWSFTSPFSIPTPGGHAAAEQHDLDYLVGGPEEERKKRDAEYKVALHESVKGQWVGKRVAMKGLAMFFAWGLKVMGAKHWHKGTPRTIDDLWGLAFRISR